MKKAIILFLCIGISFLFFLGCAQTENSGTPVPANNNNTALLQKISISPSTLSILVNQSQQFIATGQYSDNTNGNATVIWKTSNTKGTINSVTGVFEAVSVGLVNVTAQNGGLTDTVSVIINDPSATPPSIPSGLSVSSAQETSVTLTWTAVSAADDYIISYGTDESAASLGTVTVTGNTVTLSQLTSNKAYYAKVLAHNQHGYSNYSSITGFATDDGSPDTPNPVCLVTGSTTATISWDPVTGALGYICHYWQGTSQPILKVVHTTSINLTELLPSTTYSVSIEAKNQYGSKYSPIITFTTNNGLTDPPTNVQASNIGPNSAKISWDAVTGADDYTVYYKTATGNYVEANTSVTFVDLTGLSTSTQYYLYVDANNQYGAAHSGYYTFTTPISGTVASPVFTETPKSYDTISKTVHLTCSTAGATIRYTLDGTTPTESSTAYSTGITITKSTYIKAKAFKSGMNASVPTSGNFRLYWWQAVGNGVNGTVRTIANDTSDNIYIGGDFTIAGSDPNIIYIAKLNGTSWQRVGQDEVLNNKVRKIAIDNSNNLYVAGDFDKPAGSGVGDNCIAKLVSNNWEKMDLYMLDNSETGFSIYDLEFDNGTSLVAVGSFTYKEAFGESHSIFSGLLLTNTAFTIKQNPYNNEFYVGGMFDLREYIVNLRIGNPGSNYSLNSQMDNNVTCITFNALGDGYFGGDFTTAGGNPNNKRVVKYTEEGIWEVLNFSSGTYGLNATPWCIEAIDFKVYVGGAFTDVNNIAAADKIAAYNIVSEEWEPVGSGLNGTVRDILKVGDYIYVAGEFTDAGGITAADYIAKWGEKIE